MRAIPIPAPGVPLSLKLAPWTFTITQIQKHGLTADLVEGVKTLDGTKTVQIRGEEHLAPPHKVAQYKADMEHGDVFAPVIVTSDWYVVDGNTRLQAYLKLGVKTITVFRLHADYANATHAQVKSLEKLATAMNDMNGAGMPKKRIEALILRWYSPGDSFREIAKDLHFPEAAVRRVIKTQEGRNWLARLGVADEDKYLKAGHYELFAGWSQKMTDVVLAGVATLASTARFTVAETGTFGQQVIDLKSEVAKLDYIEEQDRANEDRKRGLSRKVSPQGQFRQALGTILAFRDNPVLGVEEGDPEDRKRTEEMLDQAMQVIEPALKQQRIINNPDAKPEASFTPFRFGR